MVDEIINEDYMDLIVPDDVLENFSYAVSKTQINARYTLVNVPKETIDICELANIYSYIPAVFSAESTLALDKTGVTQIRYEPEYELYGTGVLIGVIDSGINYLHPAFRYKDNTTKIQAIWDQTLNEEAASGADAEFPFGTIYTKDDINSALSLSNPYELIPTEDEYGHGTMIAGIAAGSEDAENEFSGVAPLSELVVVKLKQAKGIIRDIFSIPKDKICYQETDIMIGISFVLKIAKQLNRPVVICIALGSNQGGNYGLVPISTFLASITTLPRICSIISGGNEGDTGRHYYSYFTSNDSSKDIQFQVGEEDKDFSLEIWPEHNQRVSLDIISPLGDVMPDISLDLQSLDSYKFYLGTTYICINNILSESKTGNQLILIRFEGMQSGIWTIRYYDVDKITSELDAYLPSGSLISKGTYFIDADPFTTITTPGNTTTPITITSYDTSSGNISEFSSKGYSRNNEIKPDLVAPGSDITAPFQNDSYINATGTGAAAAIATGIVSLIFEWSITKGNFTILTGAEIKTLLIQGAERESYMEYPNRIWGYGKINLVGFFEKLIV